MNALETIAAYGRKVDVPARTFLAREPRALYGMLEYFMGYVDSKFEPTPETQGKRLRPGLLLYLAHALGVEEAVLPAALSIELYHNFSLIHDDVEDHDLLRRGRPTVWNVWGVNSAINAGDAQLLLALEALSEGSELIGADYPSLERFLLKNFRAVIEGQQLDFSLAETSLGDSTVTVITYLQMITKKTGALIATSTATPALIARVSTDELESFYEFGLNLGIAYQLYDDAQSLWATEHATGKEHGGDIRERKKTWPVLYAREHSKNVDELVRLYDDADANSERIQTLIEETGARTELGKAIEVYKTKACTLLRATSLPESERVVLETFVAELIPTQIV